MKKSHCDLVTLYRQQLLSATHWIPKCNHSIEFDNIVVFELAHDGRFLEKPDFVVIGGLGLQSLYCQLKSVTVYCPECLADLTKQA